MGSSGGGKSRGSKAPLCKFEDRLTLRCNGNQGLGTGIPGGSNQVHSAACLESVSSSAFSASVIASVSDAGGSLLDESTSALASSLRDGASVVQSILAQLGPSWGYLWICLAHLGAIFGFVWPAWGYLVLFGAILNHLGTILNPNLKFNDSFTFFNCF